jgi:hypothetical protein
MSARLVLESERIFIMKDGVLTQNDLSGNTELNLTEPERAWVFLAARNAFSNKEVMKRGSPLYKAKRSEVAV